MDWKTILSEIIIAILTSTITAILSYKKAIKESNAKIEELKIASETEIKLIKEESNKEISRIEAECLAKIKEKNEDAKNEMMLKVIENPQKLDNLINVYSKSQKFISKKRKENKY